MRAFPMQNSSADRVRDPCSKRLAPGDTTGVQKALLIHASLTGRSRLMIRRCGLGYTGRV